MNDTDDEEYQNCDPDDCQYTPVAVIGCLLVLVLVFVCAAGYIFGGL